jgi:integrase
MALTEKQLEDAEPKAKPFKITDSQGLYVVVTPSGGRLFRFDYQFEKKRQTLSFGRWPTISLAVARRRRDRANEALQEGRNPAAEKREAKAAAVAARDKPTFAVVARQWLKRKASDWSEQYHFVVSNRIEADLIPRLGKKQMGEISTADVLDALRTIEEERGVHETVRRLRNYVSMIYKFHAPMDAALTDPTTLIDPDQHLLKKPKPVSHKALRGPALGRFMHGLESYPGERATALALKLTAYTAARTNEIIGATWEEIENRSRPDVALWRLPASRMKADREHVIPLSSQALAILNELREHSGPTGYLFPAEKGRRGDHLSNNAMIYGVYRMGLQGKATVHGLRGSFSTTAYGAHMPTKGADDKPVRMFDDAVIEWALAHVYGSKTSRSYNSETYLPQRRILLQWWGDHLDRLAENAKFGVEDLID